MIIKFHPESKKLKTNSLSKIYIYISGISKERIKLPTDIRISKKNWNSKNQTIISRGNNRHPDAENLNAKLASIKTNLEKRYTELSKFDLPDKRKLKEEFKAVVSGEDLRKTEKFFDVIDEFIKIKNNVYSENTLRKYRTIKTVLSEFEIERNKKIIFEDIDENFFDEFANYLFDQRESKNNYVSKTIQLTKTFLKYCYSKKYLSNLNFTKYSISAEEIEVVALTLHEIDLLRNVDLHDKPHLERVKDIFLFMIYTGQRFIDYQNLDHADIKNNFWYLRQKKTKRFLEIPLIEEAKEILEKYAGNEKPLPLTSNQQFNAALKEICELAGIDDEIKITRQKRGEIISEVHKKFELITCHTSRRTFVTNSLRLGIQPNVVMSISGHSQMRTFQKYINTATEDKLKLAEAWEKQSGKLKVINFKDAK
ncbi:MAG: hypothetical protein CMF23_14545 [Ignavibacteriae bacterium]|nr:hypothetical protein [Ignavibacteriota bacterium]